jgi:glutathione synthase
LHADESPRSQLQLGLFRSDYLLHAPAGSSSAPRLRQVEFNTISSSFGALSGHVSALHAHFLRAHPHLFPAGAEVAPNSPLASLAGGLAAAHEAYVKERGAADARVLFVVQDGERNAFDQRAIEWELSER